MTKKEFLRKLEDNLIILEESERKDIINDYKEIIEEKTKAGESEKEIIKSFGSVDELTKEILSSYKINSDYNKSGLDTKKILENSENWIKRTAKQLAAFATEFIDNLKSSKNLSVELVFEILIKILILLVVCAILKLPFILIEELGTSIFRVFSPFDFLLIGIWKLLVTICYLVGCVLLFFAFFKNYFNNKPTEEIKEDKKETKKKQKSNIENTKAEKATVVQSDNKENGVITVIKWIIKFFITICVLVPIGFVNIGLVCVLVITIWCLFNGINIWGLAILLIGVCIIGFEFYSIVYSVTFKKFKICIWSFIAGIALILGGSLALINNIMSFNYYDSYAFGEQDILVFEERINSYTEVEANRFVIDDTLEDNVIKIEVSYYKDYTNVYKQNYDNEIDIQIVSKESDFNNFKKIYRRIIADLKEGNVYNYANLDCYEIVVYSNNKTVKLLEY